MRRREVLATTAALLTVPLAGCAHPSNVLDMDEATPERLADEVSQSVSRDTAEYTLVGEAVQNGSATASGTAPPIRPDEPVRFQDRYYELSVTEVDNRKRTQYEIQVDYDPDTSTDADRIAYDDLPSVDKTALERVIPPRDDHPDGDGFEIGTQYTYPENATADSVLVPTQQYELVSYQDDAYRVRVQAETVTEVDYRYEAAEIAASTDEYAAQIRSTYQFALTGLSSSEQDVVEKAIDGGYFDGATDAFRSLIARFRAHRGLETTDSYGTWLVEYQDTSYIAYAEFPPDVTAATE